METMLDAGETEASRNKMNFLRLLAVATLLFFFGCSNEPPKTMLPAIAVPEDRTTIHPWIAELLDADVGGVTSALEKRMSVQSVDELQPLNSVLRTFVPCRIEFSRGIGYVLCVKRKAGGRPTDDVTDQLYIAQPLPEDVIQQRVAYFEESTRPLMAEFTRRFAGCGEEMEGHAGQFVMMHDAKASDIAYYEPEELGKWRDARLLYCARNGDSVFINRSGGTAWHVFETNEIVPLFDTFPEFIKHYAEFRKLPEVFDSWASRDLLGRNP